MVRTSPLHGITLSAALLLLLSQGHTRTALAPMAVTVTSEATPGSPDVRPTPDLASKIDELESTIRIDQRLMDAQSRAYSATVDRMESNMNMVLTVIGVASILLAVLSFGVIRYWIRSMLEERLKSLAGEELSHVAQEEAAKLRGEWEPKFEELYKEYQRLVRK